MKTIYILFILSMILSSCPVQAQEESDFRLARIEYNGGGDWYNDPSALSNLIRFAREEIPINLSPTYDDVQLGSSDLHNYPFAFLTGHGTIQVNEQEILNVRSWLERGGFLYIDDDYGLDVHSREMIRQIYPEEELIEVPFDHPIYHQAYSMPDGLPKVHEHDGLPPRGYALFRNGRMVIFYTYESNLSDGWAYDVHSPPQEVSEAALQMGVNLIVYALTSAQ
ncbi:MAG: DUF4159 domain-containing protein [Balneolaceae bacterium]